MPVRAQVAMVKLGFDVTGTAMGLLTVPMALLTLGSPIAGLVLAVRADWLPVLWGLLALLLCSILARPLEALVVAIDDAAARALGRRRIARARAVAAASGALPVLVILLAEVESLDAVLAADGGAHPLLAWAWGYGAATGGWTLFAERVSRYRRTLVGIRAYAGHLALWVFSVLCLWLHLSGIPVAAAMAVPAALPVTVGLLLALADRNAIANVRV